MPGLNNTTPSNWLESVTGRTAAQKQQAAYNIAKASAGGSRNVISKTGKLLFEASTGRMTSYGSWLEPSAPRRSGGASAGRGRGPGNGVAVSPGSVHVDPSGAPLIPVGSGPGTPTGVAVSGASQSSPILQTGSLSVSSWPAVPGTIRRGMPFGLTWETSVPGWGQEMENDYSELGNLLVVPWLVYDVFRNTYRAGEAVGSAYAGAYYAPGTQYQTTWGETQGVNLRGDPVP